MKKLMSLLMVLALTLTMSVTAFAVENTGSITISNATIDEEYAVYKIFDASIKLAADGTFCPSDFVRQGGCGCVCGGDRPLDDRQNDPAGQKF